MVRHTRPLGGDGMCYGTTDLDPGPDLPADIARLSAQLPDIARIVTSPLRRAARLAEGIAAARGLALSTDARLAEMNFGAWEGMRWDNIPRRELDAWAADLLNARPHGGESVAEMAARAATALDDCQGALVVTHMGIIKAAMARAGRHDPWNAKLDFAEVVTL